MYSLYYKYLSWNLCRHTFFIYIILAATLAVQVNSVIYTYEDVELRRIFPNEFPQDTVRRSGSLDAEQLGRYAELARYFKYPKADVNSHFEELVCFQKGQRKFCKVDVNRYTRDENQYFMTSKEESHLDRRRVFCFMLICFTEDELDRVTASF